MNYQDYLIHFGIPGMKWGVRKQRPTSNVQVARSNGFASQRKAERRAKARKAVKVGKAVAVGVLAAYGATKLIKATSNHVQVKKGKEAADRILKRATYNKYWDDTTGYKEAARFARAKTAKINKTMNMYKEQGRAMNTRQAAKNVYDYYKKKKSS